MIDTYTIRMKLAELIRRAVEENPLRPYEAAAEEVVDHLRDGPYDAEWDFSDE